MDDRISSESPPGKPNLTKYPTRMKHSNNGFEGPLFLVSHMDNNDITGST